MNNEKFTTNKPLSKAQVSRTLNISRPTLNKWVKNAYSELGFKFGTEKILNVDKCNKIFSIFL
jgi:transposase-like protein